MNYNRYKDDPGKSQLQWVKAPDRKPFQWWLLPFGDLLCF